MTTKTIITYPLHRNIRIVAAATINFSLTGVRLLIEGSSYSRAAFINFGVTPLGGIDTVDSFFRTDLRIFELYDREISSKTKPSTSSAMFYLELTGSVIPDI